jgi:hypothetical protein
MFHHRETLSAVLFDERVSVCVGRRFGTAMLKQGEFIVMSRDKFIAQQTDLNIMTTVSEHRTDILNLHRNFGCHGLTSVSLGFCDAQCWAFFLLM